MFHVKNTGVVGMPDYRFGILDLAANKHLHRAVTRTRYASVTSDFVLAGDRLRKGGKLLKALKSTQKPFAAASGYSTMRLHSLCRRHLAEHNKMIPARLLRSGLGS